MSRYLCLVVAADVDDYVDWCRSAGRTPFNGSAWALSSWTGAAVTQRRTFQVTDRWRQDADKGNRRIVRELQQEGVLYGDEDGPWPEERVPDLSWPTWRDRLTRRHRQAA
ncbi:hypothetical protein AB0I27_22685 [Streptomyces sp. NPDC050597]|uniref:hypothetical protein n=1 Tax=Streptomyces sp. NPDC050597 TaxID=3157212 RepID=UPI003424B2ED